MSKIVLKLEDLHVSYGSIKALRGINLQVEEGKIVALLGANGAGKTTTLKAISGMTAVESGTITLFGNVLKKVSPEKITASKMIQSPEGRQIFPDITVEENLRIGAFTVRKKREIATNFERVYGYFPILAERKRQVAGTLSGGEQQMLAIGRALMGSPRVLLMDEPSLGLAPLIVQTIFEIIREINASGTTILIVEQNALQTLRIADYGYVLEVGELTMEGRASELMKDKRLVEAYLGGS